MASFRHEPATVILSLLAIAELCMLTDAGVE